jgi:hypothetical protein
MRWLLIAGTTVRMLTPSFYKKLHVDWMCYRQNVTKLCRQTPTWDLPMPGYIQQVQQLVSTISTHFGKSSRFMLPWQLDLFAWSIKMVYYNWYISWNKKDLVAPVFFLWECFHKFIHCCLLARKTKNIYILHIKIQFMKIN